MNETHRLEVDSIVHEVVVFGLGDSFADQLTLVDVADAEENEVILD